MNIKKNISMNNLFQFKKFKKNIDISNIREKRKVIFMNPHSYVSIFKDKFLLAFQPIILKLQTNSVCCLYLTS
jgi:hypothetical protein